jgi:hypothetical protein
MSEVFALVICAIGASAYVGWSAALIYTLRKAEREHLQRTNWKL